MYFSADSDAFEQLKRCISIKTGWTQERSAAVILEDRLDEVRKHLTGLPIRMHYSASPTLDVIEGQLEAYEEVYGEYPDLIIVDNVTNVRLDRPNGDDDPFAGLESLMDYLHTMARETEACVVGLHHVTGPFNDSAKPIPLSGVKGQITRVPETVLTLFRKPGDDFNPDALCVSTVKNRGGKADPSGQTYVELDFDGATMNIRDRVYA
ncbi:hypothetical protein JOD54_002150 [Actinokineospora baliensis]|nr:hypothetical protein [Actinokineospora baliensis]